MYLTYTTEDGVQHFSSEIRSAQFNPQGDLPAKLIVETIHGTSTIPGNGFGFLMTEEGKTIAKLGTPPAQRPSDLA